MMMMMVAPFLTLCTYGAMDTQVSSLKMALAQLREEQELDLVAGTGTSSSYKADMLRGAFSQANLTRKHHRRSIKGLGRGGFLNGDGDDLAGRQVGK